MTFSQSHLKAVLVAWTTLEAHNRKESTDGHQAVCNDWRGDARARGRQLRRRECRERIRLGDNDHDHALSDDAGCAERGASLGLSLIHI